METGILAAVEALQAHHFGADDEAQADYGKVLPFAIFTIASSAHLAATAGAAGSGGDLVFELVTGIQLAIGDAFLFEIFDSFEHGFDLDFLDAAGGDRPVVIEFELESDVVFEVGAEAVEVAGADHSEVSFRRVSSKHGRRGWTWQGGSACNPKPVGLPASGIQLGVGEPTKPEAWALSASEGLERAGFLSGAASSPLTRLRKRSGSLTAFRMAGASSHGRAEQVGSGMGIIANF